MTEQQKPIDSTVDSNRTKGAITHDLPPEPSGRLISIPIEEPAKPSQSVVIITVKAGGVSILPLEGSEFYVVTATADISIRAAGSSFNNYHARTGRKMINGMFRYLELQNNSGADNTVEIAVGNDYYLDRRIT